MTSSGGIFNFPNSDEEDQQLSEQDAERSEEDAPRQYTCYHERYVAFIDILGFKELIRLSEKEEETPGSKPSHLHVSSIFNALDWGSSLVSSVKELYEENPPDLKFSTFSDFVVITSDASRTGLEAIVLAVWRITSDWLSKGYISRGGIAKGKVVHKGADEGGPPIIFGPAYISAYKLESEIADYPRVILSKRCGKTGKGKPQHFARALSTYPCSLKKMKMALMQ